ncbi:MAG: cell division protein FtsA [Proteobacteria bacterium]|nr:cell division protein FtsA [Pseudomonadota bacterium]
MKKAPVTRNGLVAALDVGTTKTVCFIARVENGSARLVGVGHQASRGIKTGAVIDLDAAQQAMLNAVHAAEQMAGETIEGVIVNISGGNPSSRTSIHEIAVGGHEIGDTDIRKVHDQGRQVPDVADRTNLHAIPVGYSIDGSRGIRDPRGMYGQRLGVHVHAISATTSAIRNLVGCVMRCHLDVRGVVVSPYAAGLAALVDDERDLGVTLIDMGGGTTTIAVFFDSQVVYIDSVPIGGLHVTSDIARGLSTPLAHAERMKTLYGSALASASDEKEMIDVPLVGEDNHHHANPVPKSILTGVIQPRVEETLELVRSRLEASGFDNLAGRRVVLTGGASQLSGVRDLAALILDKQVRMGRPMRVHGLADAVAGPAFATCAGLLVHVLLPAGEPIRRRRSETAAASGLFGRLGLWLKENF